MVPNNDDLSLRMVLLVVTSFLAPMRFSSLVSVLDLKVLFSILVSDFKVLVLVSDHMDF